MIIGIDDAGRGPLIGNMYLAGVLLDSKSEKELKYSGVDDSKALLHSTRIKLSGVIKDNVQKYYVIEATPQEIDHAVATINLNTLEAIKAAKIIDVLTKGLKSATVYIDCPSINTEAWKSTLISFIKSSAELEIVCEHKADALYVSVSAASILAKVAREDHITELKKKYGDFGSGYPADPFTKAYLKSRGKELADTGIFRKSWSTWKKMYPDAGQASLSEFK